MTMGLSKKSKNCKSTYCDVIVACFFHFLGVLPCLHLFFLTPFLLPACRNVTRSVVSFF